MLNNSNLCGPTFYLDSLVDSVCGVQRAYISDKTGLILAESSGESSSDSTKVIRSIPFYFERLNRPTSGQPTSLIIKADPSYAIFMSENYFFTFVCNPDANFAALSDFPPDIIRFLSGENI